MTPEARKTLLGLISEYGHSLTRAQAVDAAIRAHYLRLPDKTVEGWADVLADPRRYNYVWRHMLKHACGQDLDLQPFPPPSHLQHLTPGNRYDS